MNMICKSCFNILHDIDKQSMATKCIDLIQTKKPLVWKFDREMYFRFTFIF